MAGGGFPRPYGKYELLSALGEGGMGRAYRARLRDPNTPSPPVVIKTIHPGLAKSARMNRMFIEEAHLVARLQHPNIVRVFELAQTDEGELFMALEYVDGVDLREVLEQAGRLKIEAPVWFYLHVVSEILNGLEHAHSMLDEEGRPSPIIHRDVTPSNVLLSVEGEIKLNDFGIAIRADETSSGNKNLTGKVGYMSPEILEGRALDARADIFSVGVVLWECLTLRPLFAAGAEFDSMVAITQGQRTPPSHLNPSVSPELDQIVLTALDPDPDRRFPSAAMFRERLMALHATEHPGLTLDEVRHVANVLMGREHPTGSFSVGQMPTSEPPGARLSSMPASWSMDIPAASTMRMAPGVLSDLVLNSVRATLPPVPARASRGAAVSLKQSDGRTISPLAPLDALTYLASQDIVGLSIDGQSWLDRDAALLCAGAADLLPRSRALDIQLRGEIGPVSALSVLASIGLNAWTGRLFIDAPETGRFEIDVLHGRPTFVRTEDPNLRTHLVLTRSGLLPAAEVESLLEASFGATMRLEVRVAQARGIEADVLRTLVLKQELAIPLAVQQGQYAFDAGGSPRLLETGRDELAPLLLGAIELGHSESELEARLGPHAHVALAAATALPTVLSQLPLAPATVQRIQQLSAGIPVGQLTSELSDVERLRFLATVYLAREVGLLQPATAGR